MATVHKYQTRSGATRYEVRFRTPDRRSTRRRGFEKRGDAQRWAAKVEVSKQTGAYISATAGRVTLGELGPAWLARQKGHMKPSGFRTYDTSWRTHVAPKWGRTRLFDIRHTDIQAWISKLSGRRGAVTVRTAHLTLSSILADAVRDGLLAGNPAAGIKLPPKPEPKQISLTAEQLDALAGEAGRYRGLILLLGVGGPRFGEAAALRVRDVHFLKRRVQLRSNAVKVGQMAEGEWPAGVTVEDGFQVGSLKGGRSRVLVVPQFVIDAISQTAAGKDRDDLLWPSRSGGHLRPA